MLVLLLTILFTHKLFSSNDSEHGLNADLKHLSVLCFRHVHVHWEHNLKMYTWLFFFLFTLFKFTSIRRSQSRLFFSPREQLLCICWFHCRRLLWMTLQLITLHSCYLPDSWRPTSFWGRASKITLHKTSYCLSFLPFNLSHNLGTPLIGNTLNLTGMCQREYRRHLISNRCKIYINVLRIISNKWA